MFKNYIKIAWRNIVKRSFYSALNIIGLAVGILFTLLIGVYIWSEFQVNRTLNNSDNQYFLKSNWKDPNIGPEITSLEPLAKALKENYPNLVAAYYRWDGITSVVSHDGKHLRENIQLGDDSFLSMYGFELKHGSSSGAFNNPYSAVITEDLAIKYFGKTDVIGETLSIQNFKNEQHDFSITGVLKDLPSNSVTELNSNDGNAIFVSFNTARFWGRERSENWDNIYMPSYIQLQPGVKLENVKGAIQTLISANASDFIKQNLTVEPVLLTDYYLQKDNGLVNRMLYALSFVSLFILLMAVVNFVNISVSSSSARIKEIGVRKVLGGLKQQIVIQFLVESVILVLFASLLAVCAYPMFSNMFSGLVGKELPAINTLPFSIAGISLMFILCLGILAGMYPALVLSAFSSVDSIKGKLNTIGGKNTLRKSLAGFQFFIAGLVMIVSILVSKQVGYFMSGDLGYNKEFVVSSQVPRNWTPEGVLKMETIRNEFGSLPEVARVSLSYEIPNGNNGRQKPVYRNGLSPDHAVSMQMMVSDENYAKTFEIPLRAGSFLEDEDNLNNIVLNESAVHAMGWKNADDAIGNQVRFPDSDSEYTIKGVTADFHFSSMHQKIQPAIFLSTRLTNNYRFLSFKIKPGNASSALAAIGQKWNDLMPGSSFEYKFMDDTISQMYNTELQMKKASDLATILSLVIALMGILGLVSLNIRKKAKEISVRKVLGADSKTIMSLFLKEFMTVIMLSVLIACPVAWYIVNSWLNNYAYRVQISIWPFAISFIILTLSTVLLIVLQTVKSSSEKPVKNLRLDY